jgi:slime mold repeat-containing protein
VNTNADTNTCSDGNDCSTGDHCSAGVCTPTTGPNCNDNNPCTSDGCDVGTGNCQNANLPNTTKCDSGNKCLQPQTQTCTNGKCGGGTALNCDDNNPCTVDSCDVATGCVHTNADGSDCSDDNPCTQHDKCTGGTCAPGTALDCPPSDECHEAGSCDTTTAACSNPAKKDGAPCTGGTCKSAKCVPNGTGGTSAGGSGGGEVTGGTSSGGDAGAVETGGTAGTIDNGGTAGTVGSGTSGSDGTDAGPTNLYQRDPGGCACRTGTDRNHGTGTLLGVALAALALGRRRRLRGTSRPAR